MRRTIAYFLIAFGFYVLSPTKLMADTVWGVTDQNFLVSWETSNPNNLTFGSSISGLQVNEQIVGLDSRPADGQFYAVGSSNRLYQLSMNGVATQIGNAFSIPLDGSAFGYDFNPTIDRSRVDTNTNNNYVINPNDGGISQVTDVFYGMGDVNFGIDPNIVHLGYTNSFAGATMTQLYGIDSGLDILVTQANSAGTLGTVGSLGIDISEIGGFDISGSSGIAYGAFLQNGSSSSQFYSVDLNTGTATSLGQIGGGTVITALSLQAVPEPGSASVIGIAAIGMILRRRRRS